MGRMSVSVVMFLVALDEAYRSRVILFSMLVAMLVEANQFETGLIKSVVY
jgi:hypothetical protein